MKITRVALFSVALGQWQDRSRYGCEQERRPPGEILVVRLATDEGAVGWGEACVPPPYFLPTLGAGISAGIGYLAPLVLGADARDVRALAERMRSALRGHGPARSALDMALWDLCGKAAGLPLCALWGGRVSARLPVLAMIPIGTVEEMLERMASLRRDGCRRFQIKLGRGAPDEEIARIRAAIGALERDERCWFDVNRGWLVDDAVRVMSPLCELAPLIEQPCETYAECLTVSRRTGLGLMLDEVLDGSDMLLRAVADGILDVAVLKLGLNGGLSELRFLCDLGVRLGLLLRVEDVYGTGITFAALAHLAHTLPPRNVFGLYDYVMPEVPLVANPLRVERGEVALPPVCGPGLGVQVDEQFLGEPVRVFQ